MQKTSGNSMVKKINILQSLSSHLKIIVGAMLLFIFYVPVFSQYNFKHITSRNGLTQSEVYSFLQDSKGFMWIGTLAGLNRYDGYTIKQFSIDRNNKWGLENNTIRSLIEDKQGRIWIGTDIGIDIYIPETDRFYHLSDTKLHKGSSFTVFELLRDGDRVWACTQKGLLLFNSALLQFNSERLLHSGLIGLKIQNNKQSLFSSIVHYISKTSSHTFFAGTYDNFLEFKLLGDSIVILGNSDKLKVQIGEAGFSGLKKIFEDKKENIWLLSINKGAARYNLSTKKITYFSASNPLYNKLSSNNTQCIETDRIGNIWIGTLDNGLNFIPANECTKEKVKVNYLVSNNLNRESIGGNMIYNLYSSPDDNVWVGTLGNGVSYLNLFKKNFRLYRTPPLINGVQNPNFVRAIMQDANGTIWIGMHNNGLYKFNPTTDTFKKIGFDKTSVMFLSDDAYGRNELLASTLKGFVIINKSDLSIVNIVGNSLNQGIFYTLQTASNIYWAAGLEGVFRVERKANIFTKVELYNDNPKKNLTIPQKNTRVIAFDTKRNVLWAGSEGGGLYKFTLDNQQEVKKITVFSTQKGKTESLSNNFVRSLCLVDSVLWIGTYDGLNKLNLNKRNVRFETVTIVNGLPNNMIQSIEQQNDKLWIGTNGGLSCYNTNNKKIVNYNYSDGLQSNEFSEHASFKTQDGKMLFGGIDGFNTFYPDSIQKYRTTPAVVITNISINNQDIEPGKKIGNRIITQKRIIGNDTLLLRYTENNIKVEFASPFFVAADKVRYRYMLEGYDIRWQKVTTGARFASYTNLPYGKYRLKISATNGEAEWNKPTTLFLYIQTPFYLTWWAIILYLVTILFIIYYFTKFSIINITEKNKLLLEREHVQKVEELNEQRTRFFINISHELRTPITLIVSPLKRIVAGKIYNIDTEKELNVVLRNAQRLKILTDQLLDFRKIEVGALQLNAQTSDINQFLENIVNNFIPIFRDRGIVFSFIKPDFPLYVSFDADKFEKAIFNILSNALKYTPEKGEIGINISILEDEKKLSNSLKIEIWDSGHGIHEEDFEKVFERFYTSHKDSQAGYGIGLHFSREIIQAHGGSISASKSPKGGACINIFLPVADNHIAVANAADIATSFSEFVAANYHTDTLVDEIISPQKPSVLIVEDNNDLRNYVSRLLKKDYNIFVAVDGKDGLEKVQQKNPDLIISDIMMPNLSGIELCEQIKSSIDTSHIPVILLTARDDIETKFSGYDKGADAYILKPFDDDFLQLRVRKLIEQRENMRYNFRLTGNVTPVKIEINSLDQKFIDKVIQYVDENIQNEDFSIDSLESLVGVSHSSMFRKMKALFGMTGIEFLQERRLTKAAEKLKTTNNPNISEVAYSVGYSNPKYFSKCFKEKFGRTPSEFSKLS